jgi:nucleotide-binding universal stress UspA family protein
VKVGLNRNVPRSLRSEITRYLREREANERAFDRAVLTARSAMKRLYAGLHIKPSERANAILFENRPPEGSQPYILKQIAAADSAAEQARLIAHYRVPYRTAATVIRQMSPMVVAALVEVMSPQELINNIGSLKRRGAFDNPDLKKLINEKLKTAGKAKRVSAYKAKVAAEAVGADAELAASLDEVTETQVRTTGRITRPTALLIDKSGSMTQAIEVGKQLGALMAGISDTDLYAYAFDTVAYPVRPRGPGLADWEKALSGINAGGSTSCGVALTRMTRKNQRVEQLIMITDEEENTAPVFQEAYQEYSEKLEVRPAVIFVKIGNASDRLERVCAELGVAPNTVEFRGDYYALPNIIPFLTYPSLTELVTEILDYPLPGRAA